MVKILMTSFMDKKAMLRIPQKIVLSLDLHKFTTFLFAYKSNKQEIGFFWLVIVFHC